MRYFPVLLSCFLLACGVKNPKGSLVGLQPLGEVNPELLASVADALSTQHHCKVVILPVKALPAEAFVNIKSPRYRADPLLDYLKTLRPDSVSYIMGITASDISVTKYVNGEIKKPESKYRDFGIFGLGFKPGKSSVVSYFRLGSKGPEKQVERLRKIAVHELGHNLGLDHCPDTHCVMTDAVEKMSTIDNEPESFCGKCLRLVTGY